MTCERCKKVEATIHLTQVVDGAMKKMNLCQNCAQEIGIDINSPMSITDVLLGLGDESKEENPDLGEFDLSCSQCQMTRTEFKKHGRLGCPSCYTAFMGELNSLTKAMHHSGQHLGKIPARQGNNARIQAQITRLKKEIEKAIAKESYEEAARLRDEINALKQSTESTQSEHSDDT